MSSVNKSISVMWNGSSYATENIEFDPTVEEFVPSFNVNAAEFIPDSLPRNFGQATRNFFDGHRGDDLTKVNPPCVPVEVNVTSKKTKNLMHGLGDPIPRPGGGGHPRQPTNVERRAATKAWSLGQSDSNTGAITLTRILGKIFRTIFYLFFKNGFF